MSLRLYSAPTSEPVSLAEAKTHLRVDQDTDDDLILAMIQASREQAQLRIGGAIMRQVWDVLLDSFPAMSDPGIELPMPPVQGITHVKYYDAQSVQQTIDPANYTLDNSNLPGWVLPAYGFDWPYALPIANAIEVRFVTGVANTVDVPASIKSWMLLHIGTLYRYREHFVTGQIAALPNGFVDRLLDPHAYTRI